jgi:hypothetical protein
MKFRNNKKFWYGIPANTGPFRAIIAWYGSSNKTKEYTFIFQLNEG